MNGSPNALAAEFRLWMFERLRPPLASVRQGLASADAAEALAAAQALARRAHTGDDPVALAACVPADVFALAPEVKDVIARLAVAGVPIPIPPLPADLAPDLARRFRCAQLLAAPALLPLDEASPLDLGAVADAPVERAVASGLWLRVADHARPAMLALAITIARAGLVGALVPPLEAQRVLLAIARRSPAASVAARALQVLAEPWAQPFPCPPLQAWALDAEVAADAVRLAEARGDLAWLRRFAVSDETPRCARRAALMAFGRLGGADDVAALLAAAAEDPPGLGPEAMDALRGMKRRGLSPTEDQARAVVALVFRCEAVPLEVAAESVSSRADALVAEVDAHLVAGASAARAVRFLEALGTQRAIARLVEMAQLEADPALSRPAIRALGRLEERAAEPAIAARLDTDAEACLEALGRIGGSVTVQRLRAVLAGEQPPWIGEALRVLLRLDPSPAVVAAAAEHGAISPEVVDGLPAYASAAQTDVLGGIAAAPGHPFRDAAIRALGRTGGPLAIEPLAALLSDAADTVRDAAKGALRELGQRLAGPEPPLACLENAPDPGAALVAEAALRRLRLRSDSAAEVVLLLDALVGCAHPHLVRVVRPYLRRQNPEIKKRAAACLAAAGPACAPWLLPSLADERLPVARQALLAIGGVAVPGLGPTIARWLTHPNMNLKKAAAEALVRSRDPEVIPALVASLARHDQPGLRALLDAALAAIAAPFHRSMLVDALAAEADVRHVDLLAAALSGAFSPCDLAALVAARRGLPRALLLHAYASGTGELAGRLLELDAELRRRGLGDRIPHEASVAPDSPLRSGLARADAARHAAALGTCLREALFQEKASPELVAAIRAAGGGAAAPVVALSAPEQRILAALLPELDGPARADAIALLARALEPTVLGRVLPHVDLDSAIDPRHTPLLAAVIRGRGPAAARSLLQHPHAGVRWEAAATLASLGLAGEDALVHTASRERELLVCARIDAGRTDDVLAAMEGPEALPLSRVVELLAERSSAAAALAVAERWAACAPAERSAALVVLDLPGSVLEPVLRAVVRGGATRGGAAAGSDAGDVRALALAKLSGDRAADPPFVRPLLADAHPAVREAAAMALLRAGARDDRGRVLDAWLGGAFRGVFAFDLDEQDAPAVERAVAGARDEPTLLRLLGPVAALPVACRVRLLLSLRVSPHVRVAAAARDALRRLPEAQVLPAVVGPLRAGDLSLLEVVGPSGRVAPTLAAIAQTSRDAGAWIPFCLRAAGSGVLYAAGLGERIATWAAAEPKHSALALLARLTDWYDAASAQALLRPLAPALAGPHREAILGSVLDALRDQPPALVARVLSWMVKPTDKAAVRRLAEAEAASPGISNLLDPALRDAVERGLLAALEDAGDEAARSLLSYFAGRAERPSERQAVLALLERYVGWPSRRVSLHAHRLMRTLAPREHYLRATRRLLDDPDPTTVRLALRVLAFGGDVESAGVIAERLFHPHGAVARAARAGLLALGSRAEPALLRARGKLRPDRRAAIDAVLEEIRRQESSARGLVEP